MAKPRAVDVRYAVGIPTGKATKIHCPFHDDGWPSMALYANGTWCFVCGRGETDNEFLARIGHDGSGLPPRGMGERAASFVERTRRAGPKGLPLTHRLDIRVKVWHHLLTVGNRSDRQRWLIGRGIRPRTIRDHWLGHTGDQFVIPVWSPTEQLLGVKFRRDDLYSDNTAIKYTAPVGQRTLIYRPKPKERPTIICEGELDALLLSQYDVDAVTVTAGAKALASNLSPDTLRSTDIYSAIDRDDEGDAAHAALCERFDTTIPRLDWPEGNDITDALLVYPATERRDALLRWIREARPKDSR